MKVSRIQFLINDLSCIATLIEKLLVNRFIECADANYTFLPKAMNLLSYHRTVKNLSKFRDSGALNT